MRAAIAGPLGAVLGALAVGAGAFGAHALRDRLAPRSLEIWETAASYHLVHALALVACALVLRRRDSRSARVAAGLFAAGILVFSGSLYVLAVTGIGWLGAVTPFGGISFLAGWIALAVALRE